MQCPICDKENEQIKYPIIDYSTGFIFCDGYYGLVEDYFEDIKDVYKVNRKDFSDWLRAIADARDDFRKRQT